MRYTIGLIKTLSLYSNLYSFYERCLLMPYLQKVTQVISQGAYLYILYPFVYEFWTSWVYLEPEKFYFVELWDDNLKKNVSVENKYKVIALYTLVSMHLGYKPNQNEQGWMQEYLDDVLVNEKK